MQDVIQLHCLHFTVCTVLISSLTQNFIFHTAGPTDFFFPFFTSITLNNYEKVLLIYWVNYSLFYFTLITASYVS